MLWAARQLLVPCNYLRIRQGDAFFQSKKVYDIVLPAILTGGTVACTLALSEPLALHGHAAMLESLSDLLALLIAFYMAALAAVSTFERKGIDEKLRGGDAILNVLNHTTGAREDKLLSYRQFIAYLFGYLSFLSLVLFMALLFINSAWPLLAGEAAKIWHFAPIIQYAIDPALFVIFFFGVWQLFVTSLLGIYFLADRMQTLNDPQN